jgi:hypothetical protein
MIGPFPPTLPIPIPVPLICLSPMPLIRIRNPTQPENQLYPEKSSFASSRRRKQPKRVRRALLANTDMARFHAQHRTTQHLFSEHSFTRGHIEEEKEWH